MVVCFFFFFFQAEDGIRDIGVTGVQTCALPISLPADPQRWLLDQLARYQPQPPAWAGHTDTDALLSDYQSRQRELRSLPEDQRAAARQQLRRGARNGYLDAVNARLASAIDTPTPFVERLLHFWSNHFAVSL